MISFDSPWAAVKFAARHRLRGGKVVGIPSVVVVASHVFLPPGTLNLSDERMSEEAALAAAVSAGIREAVRGSWITREQARTLWMGALLWADADLRDERRQATERARNSVLADRAAAAVLGQDHAAVHPLTARRILAAPLPDPPAPWTNEQSRIISRAGDIAWSLRDLFAERGVTCPTH